MHMCVYMSVYMCMCIYAYVYVYAFVHVYVQTYYDVEADVDVEYAWHFFEGTSHDMTGTCLGVAAKKRSTSAARECARAFRTLRYN